MKRRLLSLRYRIAAIIFVLEAAMMALVLWQTLALAVQASRDQQLAHETATLNAAGEISRNALLSEDYSELLPYIQSVPYVGGVTHAFVADHRNIVVASTDLKLMGKAIPPMESSGTEFWRTRDVANANEKLGTLAIRFSSAKLFGAINNASNLGITIALTGMSIIAVVGTLIGIFLTRRLEILSTAAQRFAAGDMQAKAGLRGNDEVAEVGKAFDRMAANIQEHIAAIEESHQRFALVVTGSNDGIWDWDIVRDETYFSPRWKEMLGFKEADPEFRNRISDWFERIHPEDYKKVRDELDTYLREGNAAFVLEHRLQKKMSEYIWVLMRGKVSRNSEGKAIRLTGSLSDITERKLQEFTIQHQAMHDAMTNLPNRIVLQDRLGDAIRQAKSKQEPLAVLMMDLDRFKEVNDTLGHHVGDLVLQEVARRLQRLVRQSDTVARFGGDEFAMVLPGVDASKAVSIVTKILQAMEPSVSIDEYNLHIETSIGIALYPQHGEDPTNLIKCADIAMYAAKHSNDAYSIYDVAHDQNSAHRLSLTADLRHAIDAQELILHYQPKIDLRSGRVVGVEALVRWQHPALGLLFPDAFIPLAERCGLIHPLTFCVLKAAIQQHHQWKQIGLELAIAINLSTRTLQDLNFPAQVAESIQSLGMDPSYLEFEITESAIMADPVRALKVLTQLSEMGIQMSIDDFGTGYSSLAYLQKLPVHAVKIDKSFVIDMTTNPNNIVIIRSTLDLGHNLGLKVIAEGVEDHGACDKLRSFGCDMAQGYYFSRPVPAEQIATWIATSPHNNDNTQAGKKTNSI
ncbi:MAG: EAL domain-containing protein [Sulfuricaulis sp.]|nr:EAL domain-containing protein [Sulfuricaulis sp.]